MTDFVELTKNDDWAHRPGPQKIDGYLDNTLLFLNPDPAQDESAERTTIVAGKESLSPQSTNEAAEELTKPHFAQAMVWPYHSVLERRATPFLAAGLSALFIGPYIMPDAAFSAYLLSGYVGGIATYQASRSINRGEPSTTPIQKFIASKEPQESNASSVQTLEDAGALAPAFDLADEIDQHLRVL